MKIGIHGAAWSNHFGSDTLYIIDSCKRIGLDYLEIPIGTDLSESPVQEVVDRCDGALEIKTATAIRLPEHDVSSDDPDCRKSAVQYLKDCVRLTHEMGGKILSGLIYTQTRKHKTGYASEAEWEHSTQGIKEVAQYARDLGVSVGVEQTIRYSNHLLNTAEQAIRFVDMVDEPNVFIHMDSFHMCMEEKDFYEPIVRVGKRMQFFHLSGNDRGVPGPGVVDWDAIFMAFRQIGFDGYAGFETFCYGNSTVFRDFIPDGDTFAEESLKFTRKMMAKYGYTQG